VGIKSGGSRLDEDMRPGEVIAFSSSGKRKSIENRSCCQELFGNRNKQKADHYCNSLMTELLEGHIRHHVLNPKRKPNSEQPLAADEVIDMVKTYLR
jgi:hypothetical protein